MVVGAYLHEAEFICRSNPRNLRPEHAYTCHSIQGSYGELGSGNHAGFIQSDVIMMLAKCAASAHDLALSIILHSQSRRLPTYMGAKSAPVITTSLINANRLICSVLIPGT